MMMKLVARYADVWNPAGPAGSDPELAFRLVRTESGFDERRVGPGGIGLTQIILPTARMLQPGVTRAELLEREGFTEVTRRSYREGALPDLGALDNRPEQTLYVEARKPM